jgi:hypothetical protein
MLAVSLVLLVGCQYDPWADRFLTAQPSEHDVAGTYVIDADSQKRNIKLAFPVEYGRRLDYDVSFAVSSRLPSLTATSGDNS